MQMWNPLSWASEHWTEIGVIGAFAAALYRVHHAITKVKKDVHGLDGAQESIEVIKTNHLPHLQVELEKANNTLEGIREDNRGLRDDLRAVLTRMP